MTVEEARETYHWPFGLAPHQAVIQVAGAGTPIRTARELRGWSMEQAAEQTNALTQGFGVYRQMTPELWARLEGDILAVPPYSLWPVAKVLGLQPADLFQGFNLTAPYGWPEQWLQSLFHTGCHLRGYGHVTRVSSVEDTPQPRVDRETLLEVARFSADTNARVRSIAFVVLGELGGAEECLFCEQAMFASEENARDAPLGLRGFGGKTAAAALTAVAFGQSNVTPETYESVLGSILDLMEHDARYGRVRTWTSSTLRPAAERVGASANWRLDEIDEEQKIQDLLHEYPGKYIAIAENRTLIAYGDTQEEVLSLSREKGVQDPVVFCAPNPPQKDNSSLIEESHYWGRGTPG